MYMYLIFQLYENFIADFEHRINPLALAELTVFIVKQIPGMKSVIFK